MKIQLSKPSSERGSILLITLIIGGVMLITLGSYLMLISTQKGLVLRSESWNASLTMAEAGVEEALAQINASPSDFSGNGWGVSGAIYGPVTRNLIGGNYSVIISNASAPVVFATGSVAVPVTGEMISRKVRVATTRKNLINVGLGSRNGINFNGNGVAVDSWNSRDPNLSTGGRFDSSKTSTNGSVSSISGVVDLGNHTVNGNLYLGPTATFNGNTNQVSGTVYRDLSLDLPNVTLPPVTWQIAPLTSGIHNITASGYYIVNDQLPIDIRSGITASLNVTILGNFNPASIQIHGGITNSGAAYVYLNGPASLTLSGNSAVDAGNRPENLFYFGLPTLTSITFGGNSTFVGVIYAPQVNLTLNGGGNNNGVVGSMIVGSVTMNGHYNFHYDEALATNGPAQSFSVTSWQEL